MKKFFLMLAIFFICGIISADIGLEMLGNSSSIINADTYVAYANAKLIYRDVFWNILYERLKLFALIGLLCFLPIKNYIGILLINVFSFIWGFYIMGCITELGIAGVIVGIFSVIPHGLLYGGLVMMMLEDKEMYFYNRSKEKIVYHITTVIVMALFLLTGCVLESLISTHFIPWVIRLSLV